MLHQSGATFHPVPIVDVQHAANVPQLGMMDMPAHHPVQAAPARLAGQRGLETVDRLDRLFHLAFQPGGERPVRVTEAAPARVEPAIHHQRGGVGAVAQQRQPARVAHHAVERIAVDHQQLQPGGGGVHRLARQPHPGHFQPTPGFQPGAEHFVMVAGDIDHLGAGPRVPQDQPQHVVVMRVPVPRPPQPPAVDDIADQVEIPARCLAQEIGQEIGPAPAGAKMRVGDEHAAIGGDAGMGHCRRRIRERAASRELRLRDGIARKPVA